jgi:poly(A) polymerase
LFVRYGAGEDGGLRKKALVYVRDEHGIQRNSISSEALRILERLRGSGHAAYVVGGAVRDLLVGRRPKDFDIVTDATPGRIKKLFWNSRVIGRRFRLVHVFFEDRIYEVATFRSLKDGSVGNDYGTMDEDVMRRDYTMNALYYDPKDETIVDYVGGFRDIKRGIIRALIPQDRIFKEDPVRMLRAAKYAASTGFAVPFALKRRIRSEARLLGDASSSRLTEELTKIISSGKSRAIAERLIDLRLLSYLLPAAASRCASKAFRVSFLNSLSELDASVPETGDSPQGLQLSFLLALLIEDSVDWSLDPIEAYPMAVQAARDALSPLNLPRVEVECAVRYVFRRRGIPLLQRHMRPRDESRERDEGRRREGPLSRDGRGKGEEAKRDRADPGADERAAGDPGRRRKRRGRGRGRRPGGDAGGSQGGGSEGAKP